MKIESGKCINIRKIVEYLRIDVTTKFPGLRERSPIVHLGHQEGTQRNVHLK